jgi:hypothetical protein
LLSLQLKPLQKRPRCEQKGRKRRLRLRSAGFTMASLNLRPTFE